MKAHICCFFALLFSLSSFAQSDPVLFSVDGQSIHRSEFEYIYKKNNADNADYTKESIDEYLDLYIKFKLKVAKAKQLKLDTIVALQKELAGYRNQLAKAYMVDKDVTNYLVAESLVRIQKDLRVSHLLISLDKFSSKEDEALAYSTIKRLKAKIGNLDDFKLMVKTMSDDKSSGIRDGDLGWMTALLPDGFYEFENAIYNLKIGEISDPVRSKLGLHLLVVTEDRVARGEIEVSHILVRARMKGQVVAGAKAKADSLYQLLKKGNSFKTIAATYSDDKNTNLKAGYLGFFGISQLDKKFEDAAFALQKDGYFSEPVRTSIGWHIILRKSKKDYNDPEKLKRSFQEKISQNDRYELAKKSRLQQIRIDGEFKENSKLLEMFSQNLNESFYSYKWQIPNAAPGVMFSFKDGQSFSISDFSEYCRTNVRTRLRMDKNLPIALAAQQMYEEFRDEKTITYEEANLEQKYPAFKALMKEYSEGILLFEATKINVWDKATQDTSELRKYFEANSQKYIWNPRAHVSVYEIKSVDEKVVSDFSKDLKKMKVQELLSKYSKANVNINFKEDKIEKESPALRGLKWKKDDIYGEKDLKTGYTNVMKVEALLPKTPKTFKECRGYVIADYQETIEKAWMQSLEQEFYVEINDSVLQNLIQ